MNTIFLFVAAAINNPLPTVNADNGAISNIMTIVFTITGAIAALVITVAGFRYVLSHGDPNLIAQSKQAIVYALIGLVVSISGAGIVNFVLGAL
jgi:hypothetical protein